METSAVYMDNSKTGKGSLRLEKLSIE